MTHYASLDMIKQKLRIEDNTIDDELNIYMDEIDAFINRELEAKFGTFTEYEYPIVLPLTDLTNPPVTFDLRQIAADLVEGKFRYKTTNDKTLWRRMWSYKDQGKSYEAVYEREYSAGFKWLIESFGSNYRMTEIQAVIGRIQLKRVNGWHAKRLDNAYKIWNVAKRCKGLRVSEVPNYIKHAAYKCYVFVKPEQLKEGWNRDRIIEEINALGVPCSLGSCSEVYLEKAFESTDFRPAERLPAAKELGETSLMFLVHPTLTDDEIQQTCDAISMVMKLASK